MRIPLLAPEPQTDLLKTPVLAQRHLDQYPGFVPYPWSDLVLASIHGKSAGLGGSITPKTPVSSALTADCGFVNIYNPGNLGRGNDLLSSRHESGIVVPG